MGYLLPFNIYAASFGGVNINKGREVIKSNKRKYQMITFHGSRLLEDGEGKSGGKHKSRTPWLEMDLVVAVTTRGLLLVPFFFFFFFFLEKNVF